MCFQLSVASIACRLVLLRFPEFMLEGLKTEGPVLHRLHSPTEADCDLLLVSVSIKFSCSALRITGGDLKCCRCMRRTFYGY